MFRNCLLLFFLLPIALLGFNQTRVNVDRHDKELVGKWQFDQLVDTNDNKIDTIYHHIGWEIPNGPTITFNEDGSYSKAFSPNTIDTGIWFYEKDKNIIIYHLYLDKKKDYETKRFFFATNKDKNFSFKGVKDTTANELTWIRSIRRDDIDELQKKVTSSQHLKMKNDFGYCVANFIQVKNDQIEIRSFYLQHQKPRN